MLLLLLLYITSVIIGELITAFYFAKQKLFKHPSSKRLHKIAILTVANNWKSTQLSGEKEEKQI